MSYNHVRDLLVFSCCCLLLHEQPTFDGGDGFICNHFYLLVKCFKMLVVSCFTIVVSLTHLLFWKFLCWKKCFDNIPGVLPNSLERKLIKKLRDSKKINLQNIINLFRNVVERAKVCFIFLIQLKHKRSIIITKRR